MKHLTNPFTEALTCWLCGPSSCLYRFLLLIHSCPDPLTWILALLVRVSLYSSSHRVNHVPAYSPFRGKIQALKVRIVFTLGWGTHQYHSYLKEVNIWVPWPGSWLHQRNLCAATGQRTCNWTTNILLWCDYNERVPVLLLFYGESSTFTSYIANKQLEIMDFFLDFSMNRWSHHP